MENLFSISDNDVQVVVQSFWSFQLPQSGHPHKRCFEALLVGLPCHLQVFGECFVCVDCNKSRDPPLDFPSAKSSIVGLFEMAN